MKKYISALLFLMLVFYGCLNQTYLSPEVEKCKIITSDGTEGIDVKCVAEVAAEKNNVSICLNGLNDESSDNCLIYYVSLTNDTSACQYIHNMGAAIICYPKNNSNHVEQDPPDAPDSLSEKAVISFFVVEKANIIIFEIEDNGKSVNSDGTVEVKIFDQSKQIFETSLSVASENYYVAVDHTTLLYKLNLNVTKSELEQLTQDTTLKYEFTFIGGGQTLTTSNNWDMK